MFDQTLMKQLIQAAEQAWYASPLQTCLIHGCPNQQNIAHQHRRTGTFGLGGAVTFLPEKNCEMPEMVGVEIGMQTQTFTIFPSNETAAIGKIAQLKVWRLNSINCHNFI